MTAPKPVPYSQDELKDRFNYDPDTGVLLWKHQPDRSEVWNRKRVGTAAGTKNRGYITVVVGGKNYRAHRLIWKLVTGVEPPTVIDHIDRDPGNNCWSNLRDGTCGVNQRNVDRYSKKYSGVPWVHFNPRSGKWVARPYIAGACRHLGEFLTVEGAVNEAKKERIRAGYDS